MRYFELVNIQQFILYLVPALVFILVFAAGLGYTHMRGKRTDEKMSAVIECFPGGIEGRNGPFPLVLTLIIAGTVVWALGYIVFTGLLGVKI